MVEKVYLKVFVLHWYGMLSLCGGGGWPGGEVCRVGWGIAPMGGAKRAPRILANLELCGSIWRSNDSLQHTKDLSTDEDVLI